MIFKHVTAVRRLLKCAVRKAQDSRGRVERKPTRQISFQPVAIGAGEEATRRPKPSMEKAPLKGVSERAVSWPSRHGCRGNCVTAEKRHFASIHS
jgi:hypothetical protein